MESSAVTVGVCGAAPSPVHTVALRLVVPEPVAETVTWIGVPALQLSGRRVLVRLVSVLPSTAMRKAVTPDLSATILTP